MAGPTWGAVYPYKEAVGTRTAWTVGMTPSGLLGDADGCDGLTFEKKLRSSFLEPTDWSTSKGENPPPFLAAAAEVVAAAEVAAVVEVAVVAEPSPIPAQEVAPEAAAHTGAHADLWPKEEGLR